MTLRDACNALVIPAKNRNIRDAIIN